jgi:hypothetical protein
MLVMNLLDLFLPNILVFSIFMTSNFKKPAILAYVGVSNM